MKYYLPYAVRPALRDLQRAEIGSLATCPVHLRLVAFDRDGVMLGRCDGCAAEAAQAIRMIREAA